MRRPAGQSSRVVKGKAVRSRVTTAFVSSSGHRTSGRQVVPEMFILLSLWIYSTNYLTWPVSTVLTQISFLFPINNTTPKLFLCNTDYQRQEPHPEHSAAAWSTAPSPDTGWCALWCGHETCSQSIPGAVIAQLEGTPMVCLPCGLIP